MINKNIGDSSTPDTWKPTSDSIRDERIDAELQEAFDIVRQEELARERQ